MYKRRKKVPYRKLLASKKEAGGRVLKRDLPKVDGRTIPANRRPPPRLGQSRPQAAIDPAKLNRKELAVRNVMEAHAAYSVPDLAKRTGYTNLEVRNALRRLVVGGYVVRNGEPGKRHARYSAGKHFKNRGRAAA